MRKFVVISTTDMINSGKVAPIEGILMWNITVMGKIACREGAPY
jgi:hypothetical protein